MTTMIRILHVTDAPDVTIPVKVYEPIAEPLDWSCRIEIGWPDGLWARDVTGIDSIQSLELALRTRLYMSELHQARRLV